MVRPKQIRKTMSKTYMLYEDNIIGQNTFLDTGKAPKDIFDLGLLALKHGWSPAKDNSKVQALQSRIEKMSVVLHTYTYKFDKLITIVEKGLDLKIDPDLTNLHDLQQKLDDLEKQEKQIKGKKK